MNRILFCKAHTALCISKLTSAVLQCIMDWVCKQQSHGTHKQLCSWTGEQGPIKHASCSGCGVHVLPSLEGKSLELIHTWHTLVAEFHQLNGVIWITPRTTYPWWRKVNSNKCCYLDGTNSFLYYPCFMYRKIHTYLSEVQKRATTFRIHQPVWWARVMFAEESWDLPLITGTFQGSNSSHLKGGSADVKAL